MDRVYSHRDLLVYQKSFAGGRRVFELSKRFPREEMYSLTDQIRRSTRSVSANVAEAWRKRRYEGSFCSALNIAEAEAAETQVWLDYAAAHGDLVNQTTHKASEFDDEILRMIVAMIAHSGKWCVGKRVKDGEIGRQRDVKSGSDEVNESGWGYLHLNERPLIEQANLLSQSPPLLGSPSSSAETVDA